MPLLHRLSCSTRTEAASAGAGVGVAGAGRTVGAAPVAARSLRAPGHTRPGLRPRPVITARSPRYGRSAMPASPSPASGRPTIRGRSAVQGTGTQAGRAATRRWRAPA